MTKLPSMPQRDRNRKVSRAVIELAKALGLVLAPRPPIQARGLKPRRSKR